MDALVGLGFSGRFGLRLVTVGVYDFGRGEVVELAVDALLVTMPLDAITRITTSVDDTQRPRPQAARQSHPAK